MSCFCLPLRLLVYRCPCPSFAPVSRTRLLHHPFPEPPNSHPRALKNYPVNRLYQHLIPVEILYHNPSTTRRIVIIFLSHVTSSLWLMSCFRVFSGEAFGGSCSIGILRDLVDLYANYCTIRRTLRNVLWKLISFSALHNDCERVLLMSLDAQQRYSHCFLDGLRHPIISYRQNASRSNFLGSNSSFLGFCLDFFCFFFRLISGEAGFNFHLVHGQFVQDNLAFFDCWFY